jgi:RNA polymerase sigma-70 factor (ECF subfamily)
MTTNAVEAPEDSSWFQTCYVAAYDDVLRFVQRRVHPGSAEDVTADVFLVAWRRLPDLPRELDEARAWLFGIAHGVLANARRGEARRSALAVRIAAHTDASDGGRTAEEAATRVDLARVWQSLPAVHQEALALTVWDDLTSTQAAAVLGISPTAYRLRLSRARRALRAGLHLAAAPLRAAAAHEGMGS